MPLGLPDFSTPPLEDCGAFARHAGGPKSAEQGIYDIEAILRVTTSLFPGEVRVEASSDPEYPEWPSIVFHVSNANNLSMEDVLDRELQWQSEIGKIAADSRDRLRLFVR